MAPSRARALGVLLAGSLLAGASGCAAFHGALLYRDGTAALDAGDAQLAIADLEQAAALDPQASEIQNHLGIAYVQAGREDDGLRAFRRAVALDCDNQAAKRNLAELEAVRARRAANGVAPAAARAATPAPAPLPTGVQPAGSDAARDVEGAPRFP